MANLFKIYAFRGRVDLNGKNVSLVDAGAERSLMRVVNTGELIRVRPHNFFGPLTPDFVEVEAVMDRLCEANRQKREVERQKREAERQKREWGRVRQAEWEEAERVRRQDPEYVAELQRQEELRCKENEEWYWEKWVDDYVKWKCNPMTIEDYREYIRDHGCGHFNPEDPWGCYDEDGAPWGFNPFYPRPAWVNWALVKTLYFKPWSVVNFITKQVGVNQGHLDGRVGMRYRQEAEVDGMIADVWPRQDGPGTGSSLSLWYPQ